MVTPAQTSMNVKLTMEVVPLKYSVSIQWDPEVVETALQVGPLSEAKVLKNLSKFNFFHIFSTSISTQNSLS